MPEPAPPIQLEVCVDSLTSAKIAARGGASRVELNAALDLGGLTPSIGMVEQAVAELKPLNCAVIAMVRPRPGGFAYHRDELAVMQGEITRLLKAGIDGVALGVLSADGTIDRQANQTLIQPVIANKKEAVFHRAFDLTPDPIASLETLIELGFHRVLTSGQAATAMEGAGVIRQLIEHADSRIEVLPGSGITPDNAAQLIHDTGCKQVHASLRSSLKDATGALNPAVRFNLPGMDEDSYSEADAAKVQAMIDVLRHV